MKKGIVIEKKDTGIIISKIRPVSMGTRSYEIYVYDIKILGSEGIEEFRIKLNVIDDKHMIKRIRRGNIISRKFLLDKKF